MLKKYLLYFLAVGLYAGWSGPSYAEESLAKEYRETRKKTEQGDGSAKEELPSEAQSRYQKIAANGIRLADTAQEWSCVSDKATGLMWEVKTHGGLHDKDKEYRWGGKGVSKIALGKYLGNNKREESRLKPDGEYDDWNPLVDRTNSEMLCGHSNWRVPTLYELSSLVYCSNGAYDLSDGCRGKNFDRDDFDRPTINTAYFPNTGEERYWSSSPVLGDWSYAWAVYFANGYDSFNYLRFDGRVRLVRVEQSFLTTD